MGAMLDEAEVGVLILLTHLSQVGAELTQPSFF